LLEASEIVLLLFDQGFMPNTYGSLNNTREEIEKQLTIGIGTICTDDVAMCRDVLDRYVREYKSCLFASFKD
jgi:hypothetical protein